jgi:hypothetical protein
MHLEAMIKRVWRFTDWLRLSEFGDAIGDRDWLNSEILSEVEIKRVWRRD